MNNHIKISTLLLFIFFGLLSCNVKNETIENAEVPLDQMIGQMIMAGFRGITIDDVDKKFIDQIEKGYIGSIVLFDYDVINKEYVRNISSPSQVKMLIKSLQSHARTPLLMAVDQEGGKVNRLKEKYGFPKSVSAKYLGTLDNIDTTKFYAEINATTLHDLGFNVNFAPSVDVDINSENPVIGKVERSYSSDPKIVIKHASEWIKAHNEKGILSTLKHFPGHGSSDADSHLGVTDITKYWSKDELLPFHEISSKYEVAIMTAHVINNNLDSFPATLSKKIIKGILRDEWNFNGIVFSDDLHMKAVNAMFDFDTIIKKSVLAGADILVFGNNLEHDEMIPTKIVEAMTRMVQNGEISESRIKESFDRIMEAKKRLGLISNIK